MHKVIINAIQSTFWLLKRKSDTFTIPVRIFIETSQTGQKTLRVS